MQPTRGPTRTQKKAGASTKYINRPYLTFNHGPPVAGFCTAVCSGCCCAVPRTVSVAKRARCRWLNFVHSAALEELETMPSSSAQQQQQMLLVLPLLCAVCAAFVGYRSGAVAWRRKQKEDQAKGARIKRVRYSLPACCNTSFFVVDGQHERGACCDRFENQANVDINTRGKHNRYHGSAKWRKGEHLNVPPLSDNKAPNSFSCEDIELQR